MVLSYWRQRAAEVITAVLADHPNAGAKERMDLLREAYPFGIKQYHPYKIWRSQVRLQLGIDKPKPRKARPSARDPVPPEQGTLFG